MDWSAAHWSIVMSKWHRGMSDEDVAEVLIECIRRYDAGTLTAA
jgi:hypothetical protein